MEKMLKKATALMGLAILSAILLSACNKAVDNQETGSQLLTQATTESVTEEKMEVTMEPETICEATTESQTTCEVTTEPQTTCEANDISDQSIGTEVCFDQQLILSPMLFNYSSVSDCNKYNTDLNGKTVVFDFNDIQSKASIEGSEISLSMLAGAEEIEILEPFDFDGDTEKEIIIRWTSGARGNHNLIVIDENNEELCINMMPSIPEITVLMEKNGKVLVSHEAFGDSFEVIPDESISDYFWDEAGEFAENEYYKQYFKQDGDYYMPSYFQERDIVMDTDEDGLYFEQSEVATFGSGSQSLLICYEKYRYTEGGFVIDSRRYVTPYPGMELIYSRSYEDELNSSSNHMYDGLIKQCKEAAKMGIEYKNDSFCSILFRYGLSDLGYCIYDIDGDGTDEFMLGQYYIPGNVIYDIYGIENGEYFHIANGDERYHYTLMENGVIRFDSSGGASDNTIEYYQYYDNKLSLIEGEHQYFVDGKSIYEYYGSEKKEQGQNEVCYFDETNTEEIIAFSNEIHSKYRKKDIIFRRFGE